MRSLFNTLLFILLTFLIGCGTLDKSDSENEIKEEYVDIEGLPKDCSSRVKKVTLTYETYYVIECDKRIIIRPMER